MTAGFSASLGGANHKAVQQDPGAQRPAHATRLADPIWAYCTTVRNLGVPFSRNLVSSSQLDFSPIPPCEAAALRRSLPVKTNFFQVSSAGTVPHIFDRSDALFH